MKIASWNVNSLRVRLPQVLDWLQSENPDVLCLQETKVEDKDFPIEKIQEAGWNACFSGQKTYNGVAIISKNPPDNIIEKMDDNPDPQKRFIGIQYGDYHIFSVYIPNGESVGSEKFHYKLEWLQRLGRFLKPLINKPLVVAGDFNIAPNDSDVYNPVAWKDRILCSQPEREALQALLKIGLKDSLRLFPQPENTFSWWDYRMRAFSRNMGLRIDLILVSDILVGRCKECDIDKTPRSLERPSDHAPVILTI